MAGTGTGSGQCEGPFYAQKAPSFLEAPEKRFFWLLWLPPEGLAWPQAPGPPTAQSIGFYLQESGVTHRLSLPQSSA